MMILLFLSLIQTSNHVAAHNFSVKTAVAFLFMPFVMVSVIVQIKKTSFPVDMSIMQSLSRMYAVAQRHVLVIVNAKVSVSNARHRKMLQRRQDFST